MYKWERNSKGNILIPRKYLQRGQFWHFIYCVV
jgi:hypothetical protein